MGGLAFCVLLCGNHSGRPICREHPCMLIGMQSSLPPVCCCSLPRPSGALRRRSSRRRRAAAVNPQCRASSAGLSVREHQGAILRALEGVKGRGSGKLSDAQQAAIQQAVEALEADGGLEAPTAAPSLSKLEGLWRLVFTTRPGSSSPIQRAFTGVDSFQVYQELLLSDPELPSARVNNIVKFGEVGQLKVEAEANTESRPLPGFTPRKGAGIPLFGKSSVYSPAKKDTRIDFQFDRAAFDLKALPFKIPYPVPFELLRDERKGWLDVTYLDAEGTFRLSRGNKGTLFVLVRD